MKRILMATALTLMFASLSFGLTIKGSKHDLSSASGPNANLKSTNQNQICIFCHTPHNATKNVPLWNRSAPNTASAAYKLYTSSATLIEAKKAGGAKLYDDSLSIFCLSCHDGTIANIAAKVVNSGVTTDTLQTNLAAGTPAWTLRNGKTPANLGSDFTNDHPIGFTFPASGNPNLHTVVEVQTSFGDATKNVFFKSTGGAGQMECSSCHKVHDNANAPFLRTTNSSSALCLSCHVK
ncbi:MAG TPA: cytochrome c3 family protein [Desulfuromonadaceae bacterium]|jgi:predicted CXXCH cytochrome family protein